MSWEHQESLFASVRIVHSIVVFDPFPARWTYSYLMSLATTTVKPATGQHRGECRPPFAWHLELPKSLHPKTCPSFWHRLIFQSSFPSHFGSYCVIHYPFSFQYHWTRAFPLVLSGYSCSSSAGSPSLGYSCAGPLLDSRRPESFSKLRYSYLVLVRPYLAPTFQAGCFLAFGFQV